MIFTIEFFRIRKEDNAHATLARVTHIASNRVTHIASNMENAKAACIDRRSQQPLARPGLVLPRLIWRDQVDR